VWEAVEKDKRMGLVKKAREIASAQINDLLEGFENPVKLLRLELSRMGDLEGGLKAALCRSRLMKKDTESEIAETEGAIEMWQQRACKSIEAGDEARARIALAKKRSSAERVRTLKQRLFRARYNSEKLSALLKKLIRRKKQIETDLACLPELPSFKRISYPLASPARISSLMEALERRTLENEAKLEAAYFFEDASERAEEEFREIEKKKQIEEELKRIKEEISSSERPRPGPG